MSNDIIPKDSIETLLDLNDALSVESAEVTAVRIDDPLDAIEDSLTAFVKDSFTYVQENRDFEAEIKDAIITRLAEADVAQLMDFYTKVQSGNTTASTSIMSPIMGIQAAKVQAEIETHTLPTAGGGHLDDRVFKKASKDVLQGIVQLNQILEAMRANNTANAQEVVVIDDKATVKKD
jgi:hypothetical protein